MKRATKRILLWFVGIVMFLFAILAIIVPVVLSPKRLTPLVNQYAGRFIDARVEVAQASASLIKGFPFLSATLTQGSVLLPQFYAPLPQADSFLVFDRLEVSVDVLSLLSNRALRIRQVKLEHGSMYLCQTPDGRCNWDIFGSDEEPEAQPDTTAGLQLALSRLELLKGARFVFNNMTDTVYYALEANELRLRAIPRSSLLKSKIDAPSNTLQVGQTLFFDHTPLWLEGNIGLGSVADYSNMSLDFEDYYFEKCRARLGKVPLFLDGFMGLRTDSLDLRATLRIEECNSEDLLALVPAAMLPIKDDLKTKLNMALDVTVDGAYYYETGTLPNYAVRLAAGPGHVEHLPTGFCVDSLNTRLKTSYNPTQGDYGTIWVENLDVDSPILTAHVKGSAASLFDNPSVDLTADARIDLDSLSAFFLDPLTTIAAGTMDITASAQCLLSDFDPARIGHIAAQGNLHTDRLLLLMPTDSISVVADSTDVTFRIVPDQSLDMTFHTDSLDLFYKYRFIATASNTQLEAASVAGLFSSDTSRVQPLTGKLVSKSLSLQTPDSTRIRLDDGQVDFSMEGQEEAPAAPLIHASLNAQALGGQYDVHRAHLLQPKVQLNLQMDPQERARQQQRKAAVAARQSRGLGPDSTVLARRGRRPDSTALAARGDSTNTTGASPTRRSSRRGTTTRDEFSYADLDFELERETRSLLRLWQVSGLLSTSRLRLATPYFPLRTYLDNLHIKITPDYVDITKAHLHADRSDLLINGRLTNVFGVLQRQGNLGLSIDLQSDTLDCNQLLNAINAGSSFTASLSSEEQDALQETLASTESLDRAQDMIERRVGDTQEYENLIIVPGNLDLQVVLAVSNAYFRHLQLSNLHGLVRAADRTLQLDNLMSHTSAGDIAINALYSTPDRENLNVGFDLDIKEMQLGQVIDLFPSLDTLFPMLNSFEGVTELQMAATSALTTEMDFILPSMRAALRLNGRDMVLLDGQTFTEISQLLMFSKKSRNVIDNISVEVTVDSSKIHVYPFVMGMDRYQAAASGTHNLDMTFDYHISIIKSPLPFRLGVNVTGNLDDFKFKLVKCLYKDEHVPNYSYQIDSVRVNLRDIITHHFSHYSFE